jgi:hypothetical protein
MAVQHKHESRAARGDATAGMPLAERSTGLRAGDQGHYADAESLGRRSLWILEAAHGPDDAEAGLSLLNLAVAAAERGRQAEAAELTARAVAILIACLPPDHPHVLAADKALARLASAS